MNKHTRSLSSPTHRAPSRARQTGATLIVGLILLLVLTVLGVSGMNTATMELQMAGNYQYQQDAFQMAEDAIDLGFTETTGSTAAPTLVTILPGTPNSNRQARVTYIDGTTPVPDKVFSTGYVAYHFDIVAVGTGSRNAPANHVQSFYLLGLE